MRDSRLLCADRVPAHPLRVLSSLPHPGILRNPLPRMRRHACSRIFAARTFCRRAAIQCTDHPAASLSTLRGDPHLYARSQRGRFPLAARSRPGDRSSRLCCRGIHGLSKPVILSRRRRIPAFQSRHAFRSHACLASCCGLCHFMPFSSSASACFGPHVFRL